MVGHVDSDGLLCLSSAKKSNYLILIYMITFLLHVRPVLFQGAIQEAEDIEMKMNYDSISRTEVMSNPIVVFLRAVVSNSF